jgi:hypothetical protein
MAGNELPRTNDKLFSLAEDEIDGLDKQGAAVGVKQWTHDEMEVKFGTAFTAQSAFDVAQVDEASATTARNVANSNGKGFIASVKNIFTTAFGSAPSKQWEGIGYAPGKTAMPDSIEGRLKVLGGIRDYLTANPTSEFTNNQITFTAANAGALYDALDGARTALNGKVAVRVTARAARDFAIDDLRNAMSGLVNELGSILPDDSGTWYYFGLVPPAGSSAPGVPDGASIHQVGPTSAAAGWPATPRAEKYRPYKKVDGVDTDFVELDLTSELQVLLENLPAKSTVHIQVTAYNAAGESARSAVASVTLN